MKQLFSTDVDSTTLDAGWKGIGARRVRARRIRRALLASPIVAGLALVLFVVLHRTHPTQSTLERVAIAPHVIALAGGSPLPEAWSDKAPSVVALDDGSHLELGANARLRPIGKLGDPARVDLALEGGRATFDIKPGGPRAWIIEAGETRVRVLGTRFTVARDGEHVRVSVERGKVRVESSHIEGRMRDLVAGEVIDVGGGDIAKQRSTAPGPTSMRVEDLPTAPPSVSAPREARVVNKRRDIVTAPEAPALPASSALVDRMAQADAARKAGQPHEALIILTSVVDHKEPGAALAAFTIGKIHSEELGDQGAGASWFERAIQLGLPVGLDEDAQARVVECYGRAGRLDDASRAASRYATKYPSGRHLARVKRWLKE